MVYNLLSLQIQFKLQRKAESLASQILKVALDTDDKRQRRTY